MPFAVCHFSHQLVANSIEWKATMTEILRPSLILSFKAEKVNVFKFCKAEISFCLLGQFSPMLFYPCLLLEEEGLSWQR